MYKNSVILVFRFHHDGSDTDTRYNSLRSSLSMFVENNEGKEDETTSTCLFYTNVDPFLLGESLLKYLYGETIHYHSDDKIVMVFPDEDAKLEKALKVGYLVQECGKPIFEVITFFDYINKLIPRDRRFTTAIEDLINDINKDSLS